MEPFWGPGSTFDLQKGEGKLDFSKSENMAGPTLLAHWALQKEEKMRAKKYEKVGVQKCRFFPEIREQYSSKSGSRRIAQRLSERSFAI